MAGQIPVETRGLDPTGTEETFTLTAGGEKLTIRTGGKDIKITVKSGKHSCTFFPVDKGNWSLKIEPV